MEPDLKLVRYKNVWDALEDDPAERQRLKMRGLLLDALQAQVKAWGMTQADAAKRLGITQPRLNDLLKDRFKKFSLGALFDLATRAGLKVKLSIEGGRSGPRVRRAA